MTTCDKTRPRLTAYLDGELADDHGSAVRGHLRECAACREVARDEAALRDGLHLLPPVDPPASLWTGIQARLAAEEVADARTPRWRRTAARWARWARARWTPTMPQLAVASAVAAAAIAVVTWRSHRADEPAPPPIVLRPPSGPPVRHDPPVPTPVPSPAPDRSAAGDAASTDDVTADLAADAARTTRSYDRVVGELMTLAEAARERWKDDDRAAFDARVAGLRGAIAHAGAPRSVQRAQRSLIRYLQSAIVRDETLLASGGPQ
ncbi:MAG TPA: anti-sigma factor [Kofleriaceae bacterium]|jgi:anti-sigma factor RsiW|nr:anti-sigma factor [Kofleriaceae bacterium]